MKNLGKVRQLGGAVAALAAFLSLSQTANAISFTWLEGPLTGQAFVGGAIQIKAVNYDTGTLYNPLPIGTSAGYSGSPGAGVATGVTALNALAGRPAINGQPGEDSWGILKITNVQAYDPSGILRDVYNSAISSVELTAMFYGVQDFYVNQVSAGSGLAGGGQVIDGTGLRVDIYSDPSKDFNQTAGPAGRTGASSYPTATNGTLELSLLSTPGFINANGTFGGAATEFESNTANVGYAALNVVGGASAAQFNTNTIGFGGTSGAGFLPGLGGQTSTDVWFAFTSSPGTSGWDITSNDPMLANVATPPSVPEAGSTLLLLGLGLALLGVGHRRLSHKAWL
jgi:hypothetical protein